MEIRRGDLVKMEGTEFHIKESVDGTVVFWAKDVDRVYRETFDQFVDRARQAGHIKIVPGEGKYDNAVENDGRDVYYEAV